MKQSLVNIFKTMGILEHVESGEDRDGYLVVNIYEKFYRIDFVEDSYDDGWIDRIREVTPKQVTKTEYT